MSEQTVQAPRPLQPDSSAGPKLRRPRQEATRRLYRYRYRWLLGAGGLLLVSTLVVVWARTRPGYDPYGWIVWGHLTIHFNLDTNGAPSWKPLPYLFTLRFALFGRYSLWLWMITSVAISLTSVVFAWWVVVEVAFAWQSILAWYLGTNTGVLYYHATAERRHPRPIVNLYPHSYGWQVFPSHTQNAAQAARCTDLTLRT